MPLRLAGEEYPTALGLDGQGWLRKIEVSDTDPALKVDQQGSGKVVDFRDGGSSALEVLDGREVTITLGDAVGAKKLLIKDSGGAIVATIDSDGHAFFGGANLPPVAETLQTQGDISVGNRIKFSSVGEVKAKPGEALRFMAGLLFEFRDADASEAIRASLDSATGALRLGDSTAPVDKLDVVSGDISLVTQGQGIALIPDATAGAATVDDLTKKRLRLVKRATAPTSAYIAFSNNPGTDTFYLIAEDV